MKQIFASELSFPILFTFNIRRSIYESFGLAHFQTARKMLGCNLLPVVTDEDTRI